MKRLLAAAFAAFFVPVHAQFQIETDQIQDDAVTFDKVENIATDRILGRDTAGSGNIEELTAAEARTLLNVATGSHSTECSTSSCSLNASTTLNGNTIATSGDLHDAVTVTDSAEIDLTLTGQDLEADIVAGSIDETKLDASVNASLDLADSAVQPGDNVSDLTNDAGYLTSGDGDGIYDGSGSLSSSAIVDMNGNTFAMNYSSIGRLQIGPTLTKIASPNGLAHVSVRNADIDIVGIIDASGEFYFDGDMYVTDDIEADNVDVGGTLDVTNHIVVGGLVDGRNVANDGTKLDTIETNADVTDEANVVSALSGATLTDIGTPASGDLVLIQDVSDSDNLKVVQASTLGGGGGGSVTSVAVSGSDGIEVDSGSPITSSGTIALGVDASSLRTHINVEDGADVTDATNVDSAGAVMNTDTSTASMDFVVDEDDMSSDSATKLPTQQSVKAYVDDSISLEFLQLGNSDTSTTLDSATVFGTAAPMFGNTREESGAAFTKTSGTVITVNYTGYVRLSSTALVVCSGQRAAPEMRFYKENNAIGPIAGTYVRNQNSHNNGTMTIASFITDVTSGDEFTIDIRSGSSVSGTCTFPGANVAQTLFERVK